MAQWITLHLHSSLTLEFPTATIGMHDQLHYSLKHRANSHSSGSLLYVWETKVFWNADFMVQLSLAPTAFLSVWQQSCGILTLVVEDPWSQKVVCLYYWLFTVFTTTHRLQHCSRLHYLIGRYPLFLSVKRWMKLIFSPLNVFPFSW